MLQRSGRARRLRGQCKPDRAARRKMTTPPSNDAPRRPARRRRAEADAKQKPAPPDASMLLGEVQFRRFAESSEAVFWMADLERGRLLYVSPRVEALWGVDAETLMREPQHWNAAL